MLAIIILNYKTAMLNDLHGGGVVQPGVLYQIQSQGIQKQRESPNIPYSNDIEAKQRAYDEEAEKKGVQNLMTNLMTGGAQGLAGRGVPAYNKNEANGRTGLVDPSLTGQETQLPQPIDRQIDQASNLAAIL